MLAQLLGLERIRTAKIEKEKLPEPAASLIEKCAEEPANVTAASPSVETTTNDKRTSSLSSSSSSSSTAETETVPLIEKSIPEPTEKTGKPPRAVINKQTF